MRMLIYKKVILFFLVLAIGSGGIKVVQAQSGPAGFAGNRTIIPPAPKTGTLGQFGHLPTDLNGGVVALNLPLVEAKGRQLSLPVSLGYRTTGIRVEDIASWVGLGWNLSAGGVITRTVRGAPDEKPDVGYYDSWALWYLADSTQHTNPHLKKRRDYEIALGRFDLEPDLYSVSFAGYSATILCDAPGHYRISPYQDWRITEGGPGSGLWEIIVSDGTRYRFGAGETTEIEDANVQTFTFLSAWHLVEIISADDTDHIYLDYTPDGRSQTTPIPRITKVKLLAVGNATETPAEGKQYCPDDPPFSNGTQVSSTWHQTLSLSRISTAMMEVVFRSDNTGRYDLDPAHDPPGRILRSIEVYPHGATQPQQRFLFGYDPLEPRINTAQRLQLLSLREEGKPPTVFTYNGLRLPGRQSYAQDHWGYYNGAGNRTLIPRLPDQLVSNYQGAADAASAMRATNAEFAQAGVLTGIQYPTGGGTNFYYESNRVTQPYALRYGEASTQEATYQVVSSGSATLEPGSPSEQVFQALYQDPVYPGPGQPYVSAQLVTLPQGAQAITLTGSYTRYTPPRSNGSDSPPEGGQLVFGMYTLDMGASDPIASALRQSSAQLYHGSPTTIAHLPAGTYLLLVVAFDPNANASLTLKLTPTDAASNSTDRLVGGLRIRRMADYASQGDSIVTTYDYTQLDPQSGKRVSSGVLFFEPQYTQHSPCNNLFIAAYDTKLISFAQEGYHIGYAQVTVTQQGASAGKTTSTYLNSSESYGRSLPLAETHWNAQGNLVQHQENAYEVTLLKSVPGATVTIERIIHLQCAQVGCGGQYYPIDTVYLTTHRPYTPGVAYRLATHTQQYATTTLPASFTAQEVYYRYGVDYAGRRHTEPTQIRQVLAPGDTLLTIKRYANDFDSTGAKNETGLGLQMLQRRHLHTAVVEDQRWHQQKAATTLLSSTLTHYQDLRPRRLWQLPVAAPAPITAFVPAHVQGGNFVWDSRYELITLLDQYDALGNLVQQHRQAGPSTSYVWAYAGTHLIAQVTNALYEQIAYSSFEGGELGRWQASGSGGQVITTAGYTGTASYQLTAQSQLQCANLPAGPYQFSCWLKSDGGVPKVNGQALINTGVMAGGWQLYQATLNAGAVTLTGAGQVDELRLYPVGAQMTTLTYRPLVGVTSQTGPDNRTAFYEYDALGRLLRVKDEQGRILSQQEYKYALQP